MSEWFQQEIQFTSEFESAWSIIPKQLYTRLRLREYCWMSIKVYLEIVYGQLYRYCKKTGQHPESQLATGGKLSSWPSLINDYGSISLKFTLFMRTVNFASLKPKKLTKRDASFHMM